MTSKIQGTRLRINDAETDEFMNRMNNETNQFILKSDEREPMAILPHLKSVLILLHRSGVGMLIFTCGLLPGLA